MMARQESSSDTSMDLKKPFPWAAAQGTPAAESAAR